MFILADLHLSSTPIRTHRIYLQSRDCVNMFGLVAVVFFIVSIGTQSYIHNVFSGRYLHHNTLFSTTELKMSTKHAQIPLRIAVAGAGVGGVLLGYALEKKGFNVTVFEKTAKFSRFGGPIQLASNALSCVNALSPELFEQIMGRFTFTGTRKCGIKDGIRNEWYSVFDSIKNLAKWNSLPYTGVIDRPDLQEILLSNMKNGTIVNSMEIRNYKQHEGNTDSC